MAKLKIAKHISPRPMIEPNMIKVPYSNHFPGCITSMYKLDTVVKAIHEKITK